jgi:hypothetical protein
VIWEVQSVQEATLRNSNAIPKMTQEQIMNFVEFMRIATETLREVHGLPSDPPKPKNVWTDPDWLPKDWTPEDDKEDGEDEPD